VSGIWATYKPDSYFALPLAHPARRGPVLDQPGHEIDFLRFCAAEITWSAGHKRARGAV